MRILVVSDTHGSELLLRRALLAQPKAEIVIHLGDGESDVEYVRSGFPDKMFLQVKGNCDWGSRLEATGEFTVEGAHIFYTHGHLYNVKYGMYEVKSAARDTGANILLYGHTHIPHQQYEDGLYILNPGSLHSGSYGIIDITPQGIVLNIFKSR